MERHPSRHATAEMAWNVCDGLDGRLIVTCRFETREATQDKDRLAHNPEVAGSNPVPATTEIGPDQAKRWILTGPTVFDW
jgi:hypothetical protein